MAREGTIVRLLVRPAKGDPSDRKTVILVRDEIKLTANLASAEVFDVPAGKTTVPIGVIELPAFYGSGDPASDEPSTTHDVQELIGKLKDMGVKGLVLDLRRNGGGLLSEAVGLTGSLSPTAPLCRYATSWGRFRGVPTRMNSWLGTAHSSCWFRALVPRPPRLWPEPSKTITAPSLSVTRKPTARAPCRRFSR